MSADLALFRLVGRRGSVPFSWGSSDCAQWSFDAAEAVTGRDPAPDLRGRYSTAEKALQLLRELGGLRGLADARFGPSVPVADARDGDILLLPRHLCVGHTAAHGALGVAWRTVCVVQGDHGLVYVRSSLAVRAWRPAP